MKLATIFALAATSLAIPMNGKSSKRQSTGITANEFKEGGCNDIIMIWSRGSTEVGNMGTVVGPDLADNLKEAFPGQVAVQGVDYAALISTNFVAGGADPKGISEMQSILSDAISQCPNSTIVTGGYSQGAAINHRVIEALPADQMARIAGVIMFGDTQNAADDEQITNFSTDKTKIICAANPRDRVCDGVLNAAILPPHLSYGRNAGEGADFLVEKINAAQGA
ncbi:cutinase [Dactylonectria macrodidyma]|uniref:Cutinase n=1 Tax=Dactylonectria macrodidyma TaxID=307937 RepID=A0A9P9IUE1_9HYPO|nr:cutinase [Dactylonectria macrodidyma]